MNTTLSPLPPQTVPEMDYRLLACSYPAYDLNGVFSYYVTGQGWIPFPKDLQLEPCQQIIQAIGLGATHLNLQLKKRNQPNTFAYPDFSVRSLTRQYFE